jgi:hypothetical protein
MVGAERSDRRKPRRGVLRQGFLDPLPGGGASIGAAQVDIGPHFIDENHLLRIQGTSLPQEALALLWVAFLREEFLLFAPQPQFLEGATHRGQTGANLRPLLEPLLQLLEGRIGLLLDQSPQLLQLRPCQHRRKTAPVRLGCQAAGFFMLA